MDAQSRNLTNSGVEPVDELLGGLECGQLYLVHGEASGKSVFGIKFLIEGLRQGENCALVIRYSPEDAVQRFARLGYDCLEDVYSGRLVILEYSDDIIHEIGKLPELTPVLRELEWLLGETRPKRLIFDPVTSVLAGTEGKLELRAREFAQWARSFGSTVVLVASDSNQEIINSFEPLVVESFRFDVRGVGDREARYLAFEKSLIIPDQAIEVDPSRGVFLLGRAYAQESTNPRQAAPQPPSIGDLDSIREELRSARDLMPKEEGGQLAHIDLLREVKIKPELTPPLPGMERLVAESEGREMLQTQKLTLAEEKETQIFRSAAASEPTESISTGELDLPTGAPLAPEIQSYESSEGQFNELSDLLDDLSGSASPLELDLPDVRSLSPQAYRKSIEPGPERASNAGDVSAQPVIGSRDAPFSTDRGISHTAPGSRAPQPAKTRPPRHGRASDRRIDSAMAARATELLLRPPGVGTECPLPPSPSVRHHALPEPTAPESLGDAEVQAKDFNVLIIEDDAETCELLTDTLGDYLLEVVHDGVSGLAKLISLKPDLVVLDFDLPIIDGFKVLRLIRSVLNVPIIIISGSRLRAIDRVMAAELGADYYLTKPFSTKELKHKARQLIARHRGISSWLVTPSAASRPESSPRGSEPAAGSIEPESEPFIPYAEFAAEVEKRVKATMENGAAFSIVGCRLQQMTANRGRVALRLFEIVRGLAREADLTSTNSRNDLVILLADADTAGARAFAARLRERVFDEFEQEPALWMRSFPELKESTQPTAPADILPEGGVFNRRSSDQVALTQDQAKAAPSRTVERSAEKADARESFIDFLEHL